jgi:tRNA(Ile)-lysidine synthase
MLNRFRHIVEEMRRLIDDSRSASYLLAVSGGVDSMCLADLWVRAFGAESCAMAHCNFNLRGEDSCADEALVTRWAQEHGVLLHKTSFDTVGYASENGVSIEMAARELRYRWFGELCGLQGYKAVVVAHHADDNAETLVLNMVRGSGLKGFSGMKPITTSAYGTIIVRPLLTFTRKQIEGHAFAWKVPFREDKTNASVEYRRNSIRHEVFPLFERMNPSYVRTLNREMTYLNDASTIVECWCREHAAKVLRHPAKVLCHPGRSEGSVSLDVPSLLAIPQWRYLLYYITEPYGFNSATLESLEALLTSDRTASGKRFEADEYILLVERDMLVINRKSEAQQPAFTQVPAPGVYHVGGSRITVEVLPWTSDMQLQQPEDTMILDSAKLAFPFVLRSWRSGDWMIPLGMKGKKKLSDLFTDLKYGSAQKSSALVLVDCKGDYAEQQHVAGVVPVRLDGHYKVTSATREIIRITITDNQ